MKALLLTTSLLLLAALPSCYKVVGVNPGDGLDDWTDATHGGDATADYDVVFPSNQVNRIDLVISSGDWSTMQSDLSDIINGSGGGGPGGGFSDETPVYVPCEFYFNGKQWYHVGVRYKGNSSLYGPYNSGIGKLPLRFDFDEFEDTYPEIWDQTFYGFRELSMSNNYKDASFMRQKTADAILRDFGVPTTRSAYYRVYIDHGDGPVYFGLYTMVEVVFDTFLDNYFGSSTGNCYKPDGDAASWEEGSFNTSELEKKTNETAGDWSDLQAFYNALHDGTRTTNPTQWRAGLDAVFDTNGFLKWLAANTTFQNWDVYGRMTHNYYLYHDPADDLIKWIPWDHNESFADQGMGALDFEMTGIGTQWPLISYLLDDATYKAAYDQHIQDFIDGVYAESAMSNRFNTDYNLVYDYAIGSEGEVSGYTFLNGSGDFTSALSTLISHTTARHLAANTYLGN